MELWAFGVLSCNHYLCGKHHSANCGFSRTMKNIWPWMLVIQPDRTNNWKCLLHLQLESTKMVSDKFSMKFQFIRLGNMAVLHFQHCAVWNMISYWLSGHCSLPVLHHLLQKGWQPNATDCNTWNASGSLAHVSPLLALQNACLLYMIVTSLRSWHVVFWLSKLIPSS
jgi:hypothetical protein